MTGQENRLCLLLQLACDLYERLSSQCSRSGFDEKAESMKRQDKSMKGRSELISVVQLCVSV